MVGSALVGAMERRRGTGGRGDGCRQDVCPHGSDTPPHPAEPDCGWFSGR
jgi:hypothetical protein